MNLFMYYIAGLTGGCIFCILITLLKTNELLKEILKEIKHNKKWYHD